MKLYACLFVVLCCSFVVAAEEQSVLVKSESAAPVVATNPVQVAATPLCVACRLYNLEETCNESCRKRLFGGYVKKNVVRQVYRPVR